MPPIPRRTANPACPKPHSTLAPFAGQNYESTNTIKLRATLLTVLAIILLLAGLGAGKTGIEAINEDEIMSMGRRHTRLIQKESDPLFYWITVSIYAALAAGLIGASAAAATSAIRGAKKHPTR